MQYEKPRHDIRPAFLTPTQRSYMLALVEQDRRQRRTAHRWLTVAIWLLIALLGLWGLR